MSTRPARKPRTTLRDAQKALTRERILTATKELFAQNGYYQTTIDQIAGAVGTSRQTFYLHFPDKEAVLKEIVGDYYPRAAAQFLTLPGPIPSREEILEWVTGWSDFARRERSALLVMTEIAMTATERPTIIHGIMEQLLEEMATHIPAFAATQRGDTIGTQARARAELLMYSMTWASQIVQQSGDPAYGKILLQEAAGLIHDFVGDSRFVEAGLR